MSSRPLNLVGLSAGAVLLAGACTQREEVRTRWVEPPAPEIIIASSDSAIARTPAVPPVPAGPIAITFAAIIRPDPDHYTPVVASITDGGLALRVADAGVVRVGDTLVLVRLQGGDSLRALVATKSGAWWPRPRTSGRVEPGDTVGILQHEGRFIADGRVEGLEASALSIGDSALLIPSAPRSSAPLRGRVEAARASSYGTDVSVHFHGQNRGLRPNDLVSVTLFVESPSLKRVPASAVVALSWGSAVLIPDSGRGFRVRFVDVDSHGPTGRIVHQGLEDGSPVVEAPSPQLVAAAESTLKTVTRRRH